jgi:hypothetical protein
MRQDNLPELPDHQRRHWYCQHNPAGIRRESGTFHHPTGETPILDDHEVPGASGHPNPHYCIHCPAPTHPIPLLTYNLPNEPHSTAQTTAANSTLSPPPTHAALLPTFPPRVHPRTSHHSRDTATDHTSSLLSSTHQHHKSPSWDQEDHGITVSEAYWPAGIKPAITDMPGKPSAIHVYPRSLEREHVGAGDSFMELSEITVTEKAWRILHQLLDTLCL